MSRKLLTLDILLKFTQGTKSYDLLTLQYGEGYISLPYRKIAITAQILIRLTQKIWLFQIHYEFLENQKKIIPKILFFQWENWDLEGGGLI